MPKIKKEEIQKINSKCKNDFRLDVEYYLFHNEKTLIKNITIDNEHYLQFRLSYNWKNQIVLHISKYHHKKDDYFATSNGLGKSKILDFTEVKRKNVNSLIEFTHNLTDDELMKINSETDVIKSSIIVASEEF